MRVLILAVIIYGATCIRSQLPPSRSTVETQAATRFIKARPWQRGSPVVNRRHTRKRIKRVVYRKPPCVYVIPDRVIVMTWSEYWRGVEAARIVEVVRWF
jgi:hypothetical protein